MKGCIRTGVAGIGVLAVLALLIGIVGAVIGSHTKAAAPPLPPTRTLAQIHAKATASALSAWKMHVWAWSGLFSHDNAEMKQALAKVEDAGFQQMNNQNGSALKDLLQAKPLMQSAISDAQGLTVPKGYGRANWLWLQASSLYLAGLNQMIPGMENGNTQTVLAGEATMKRASTILKQAVTAMNAENNAAGAP